MNKKLFLFVLLIMTSVVTAWYFNEKNYKSYISRSHDRLIMRIDNINLPNVEFDVKPADTISSAVVLINRDSIYLNNTMFILHNIKKLREKKVHPNSMIVEEQVSFSFEELMDTDDKKIDIDWISEEQQIVSKKILSIFSRIRDIEDEIINDIDHLQKKDIGIVFYLNKDTPLKYFQRILFLATDYYDQIEINFSGITSDILIPVKVVSSGFLPIRVIDVPNQLEKLAEFKDNICYPWIIQYSESGLQARTSLPEFKNKYSAINNKNRNFNAKPVYNVPDGLFNLNNYKICISDYVQISCDCLSDKEMPCVSVDWIFSIVSDSGYTEVHKCEAECKRIKMLDAMFSLSKSCPRLIINYDTNTTINDVSDILVYAVYGYGLEFIEFIGMR